MLPGYRWSTNARGRDSEIKPRDEKVGASPPNSLPPDRFALHRSRVNTT